MLENTTDVRCERCGRLIRWVIKGNSFNPEGLKICRQCAMELQREAREKMDIERKALELPRLLLEGGVPAKYAGATFGACDTATDELVKAGVLRWAEHPRGFLLIIGDIGVGKTWMATCAFRHAVARYGGGRWASVFDLLAKVKDQMSRRGGGWRDGELRLVKETPLLLLDDVGVESPGRRNQSASWAASVIGEVVACRYDGMRPTIMTTNLSVDDLAGRWDARTMSRVLEGEQVFALLGSDRRLAKSEPETTAETICPDASRN